MLIWLGNITSLYVPQIWRSKVGSEMSGRSFPQSYCSASDCCCGYGPFDLCCKINSTVLWSNMVNNLAKYITSLRSYFFDHKFKFPFTLNGLICTRNLTFSMICCYFWQLLVVKNSSGFCSDKYGTIWWSVWSLRHTSCLSTNQMLNPNLS